MVVGVIELWQNYAGGSTSDNVYARSLAPLSYRLLCLPKGLRRKGLFLIGRSSWTGGAIGRLAWFILGSHWIKYTLWK